MSESGAIGRPQDGAAPPGEDMARRQPAPAGTTGWRLERDAFGRLRLTGADGAQEEVVPVRAFPLQSADTHIALVGQAGRELAWIERLADLPDDMRELVHAELAGRELMPEIRRIVSVSGHATPATWEVETDRGATRLALRSEQDIRRVSGAMLLIADADGLQFVIRDLAALDRASRRLLDRFL